MRRSYFSRWDLARQLRRAATPEERILWQRLRRNQVLGNQFRRQHVLGNFIVDFYCPSARLVVELDGAHHAVQIESDRERDAILRGRGYTVLRFPNWQIRNHLTQVLQEISFTVKRLT